MGQFLNQVQSGVIDKPHFVVIYGTPGVGKTTFAAQAPDVIFIGPENGTARLEAKRMPTAHSFQDVKAQIGELITDAHSYKTMAIDSLDWIEPLIWREVCASQGVANIEEVGGGYAKGYIYAMKVWEQFKNLILDLREKRKLNVILIAHSHVKTVNDPFTNSSYDRYEMKMHKKAWELMFEAADTVLFARHKMVTVGKENQKHKALGDGSRVMYTEERPGFAAKNRFSLPFCMPLDYLSFDETVRKGSADRTSEVLARIEELIKIKPELEGPTREAIIKHKDNAEFLGVLENRLRTKINEGNV